MPETGHRLRFGLFELDCSSKELRRQGVRVRLAGQPIQILELLLQRPGEVVTREEIRQALWAADTYVDFEHNLNTAIKRLRAALHDSADHPLFIETLPRRGYRFLLPVTPTAPVESMAAAGPVPVALVPFLPPPVTGPQPIEAEVIGPSPTQRRRVLVAVVALAVLALAVTGWWRQRPGETAADAPIRSLAVLTFESLSKDPEQAYIADALTDALITNLAQIKTVKVISRTSVLALAKRPVPEIARELQVDAVVEGSVLREGDTVRITAQLIHGATDRHLWAESYDAAFTDVLAVQARVARTIAREIRATLSPTEAASLDREPQLDPAAYELYLRGRHLMTRRTERELRLALGYFEQAAARDPRSALPLAGIAQVWDALASWPGYVTPRAGYPKARAAALRALSVNESLAEAHTALASVEELYDWNLDAAERRYQRAIALNPNYALAHHRYGMFLSRTGRAAAALESGLRARALDPLSLDINMWLAGQAAMAGRLQEALAGMESAIELDRNYFDGYVHVADFYQRAGSVEKAIAAAERGVELSDRSAHALHGLALIHVRLGHRPKYAPLIAELERHPTRNAFDIAGLYLILKQREPAIQWLQRACEDRVPAMAFFTRVHSGRQFDVVRQDPRFAQILRCVQGPPPPE